MWYFLPSPPLPSSWMPRHQQPLLVERLSAPQVVHNAQTLAFSRTSVSILAGCIAGVFGLTGVWGFAFYLLSVLLTAAVWWQRLGGQAKPYFAGSWRAVAMDGLSSGLMSYVMFWTLLYDVVYIY